MTKPGFHGLYAMQYAWFDDADQLDDGSARAQVEASIEMGAHGLAVLGLGTEVTKLTTAERIQALRTVASANNGRLPLAVTIAGADVGEQRTLAEVARDAGADWLILQPPHAARPDQAELIEFFTQVATGQSCPVAIQNAAAYIGVGLEPDSLAILGGRAPEITLIKAESPAIDIAAEIERLGDRFTFFNGRGGLELTDNLRAGCAGLIVAPECIDVQAEAYQAFRDGDLARADASYQKIAPLIVFIMQSLDHFICYGKRAMARRIGVRDVHDRSPALMASPTGEEWLSRLMRDLAPL